MCSHRISDRHAGMNRKKILLLLCIYRLLALTCHLQQEEARCTVKVKAMQILLQIFCLHRAVPINVHLGVPLIQPDTNRNKHVLMIMFTIAGTSVSWTACHLHITTKSESPIGHSVVLLQFNKKKFNWLNCQRAINDCPYVRRARNRT